MRLSRFSLATSLGAMTFLFAGCSSVPKIPDVISEYKIDIQQGNVITQEMVAQLKPGQSKDQVRFILGSPMLADVFHGDRWDYVYRMKKGNADVVETRAFSIFFVDGKLVRVGGDVVASSSAAATEGGAQPERKSRVLDLGVLPPGVELPPEDSDKGYLDRLIDKLKF
jgi:outer membrane protein assembly factor BamE